MEIEEIRRGIGQNILLLRAYYGMSRRTLAKLIGIPECRLRRVEDGDAGARLYDFHLKRIARVFDVSIDVLVKERLVL